MSILRLLLALLTFGLGPSALAQQLLYIHTDHLNTPRMVTDGTGTPVWRWDQIEPFGDNPPDEDPDGNGGLGHMPLRFPGQYFDKETNLHYNYFRDYDPHIGRYIQPDPWNLLSLLPHPAGLAITVNVTDALLSSGLSPASEPGLLEMAGRNRSNFRADPNLYLYARNDSLRGSDPLGLLESFPGGEMPPTSNSAMPGENPLECLLAAASPRRSCYRYCSAITGAILRACSRLTYAPALLACIAGATAFEVRCVKWCNDTYRRRR